MHWLIYFLVLVSSLSAEEPLAVYLTWTRSPTSTMVVQWLAFPGQASHLYYQKIGDPAWEIATLKSKPIPGANFLIYSQELTGLSPATAYRFHIGERGAIHRFRTLPEDLSKPLRFVVGGDIYHDTLDHLKIMNQRAASTAPQFALLGGDLAYTFKYSRTKKEDVKRWVELLQAWEKEMVTPDGFLVPIIPAIGNHDTQGWYEAKPEKAPGFYALFPMPGPQGYNSLDFGNYMTLWILDTDHTHPITGAQKEWLRATLAAKKERMHKFALYHVPAYPSRRDPLRKIHKRIRMHWVPLFELFGLSAAFENHDHRYKRTHPLIGGKIDPQGVLYIGDGGWGTAPSPTIFSSKKRLYLAKVEKRPYFLLVELENGCRTFTAISNTGEVFDHVLQGLSHLSGQNFGQPGTVGCRDFRQGNSLGAIAEEKSATDGSLQVTEN